MLFLLVVQTELTLTSEYRDDNIYLTLYGKEYIPERDKVLEYWRLTKI